jgi:hypothetical protein
VGLASALALVHPIMWFVPVLGAVISAFGIRATKIGDPPPTGRTMAVIGLALSMIFAGWAPTHYVVRRARIEREAKDFGQHWFEMVQQQRTKELHQLNRVPSQRRAAGVSLEDAYNTKPEEHGVTGDEAILMSLEMSPESMLEKFVNEEPLKDLLAAAEKGELSLAWKDSPPAGLDRAAADGAKNYSYVEFDHLEQLQRTSSENDEALLIYSWKTNDGERARTRQLRLKVRRNGLGIDFAVWQEVTINATL